MLWRSHDALQCYRHDAVALAWCSAVLPSWCCGSRMMPGFAIIMMPWLSHNAMALAWCRAWCRGWHSRVYYSVICGHSAPYALPARESCGPSSPTPPGASVADTSHTTRAFKIIQTGKCYDLSEMSHAAWEVVRFVAYSFTSLIDKCRKHPEKKYENQILEEKIPSHMPNNRFLIYNI